MTRRVVKFRAWHSEWLEDSGESKGGHIKLDRTVREALEKRNSWTAFVDDEVVACGGTIEMWTGRHTAWMQMNKASAKHMLFITKAAMNALQKVQGRIEMSVQRDFAAGHRWAHMLGFCIETTDMLRYGPKGETHTGYVRFN
jgi:hypothetical protein